MQEIIRHTGKVISSANGVTRVLIEQNSACGNCAAKRACHNLSGTDKEIIAESVVTFAEGETVVVTLEQKYGMLAVFLAFVVPFLILISLLIIALHFLRLSEGISGLLVLIVLSIYYCVLSLFKRKLKNKMKISIDLK